MLAAAFLAVALLATAGQAQEVHQGSVSGRLRSAGTETPAGGAAALLTSPSEGFLILTQFCSSGEARLRGSSLGVIPKTFSGCDFYFPGIALPAGENLICENPDPIPRHCLVNSVLQKGE